VIVKKHGGIYNGENYMKIGGLDAQFCWINVEQYINVDTHYEFSRDQFGMR
jgi:hypothetical protein